MRKLGCTRFLKDLHMRVGTDSGVCPRFRSRGRLLFSRTAVPSLLDQGPVLWKTTFPWTGSRGNGSGSNESDGQRWGAADEPSLARLPAAHLLLGGLVPNRLRAGTTARGLGTPAIGDAAFSTSGTSYPQQMDSLQQGFSTSALLIFLDRTILCRGDCPVHLECLAYLSKPQQPTPFPIITIKSVSKHCQLYSGGGIQSLRVQPQ